MAAKKRQLKAGVKVTYHGGDGDRDARIVRFNGVGGANVAFDDDDTVVMNAREGRNPGEWTAIPPRRAT